MMETVKIVIAGLVWLVPIWRLPAAIRLPQQRALWLAFTGLAIAATTSVPLIGKWIDSQSSAGNLSVAVRHLVGVIAISAVLDFVIAMTHPNLLRRSRLPNLAIGLAVVTAMGILFASSPISARVENPYEAYLGSPPAVGYLLTFVGYLALATASAAVMCLSYARHTGRSWFRTGLQLMGTGLGMGAIYAIFRASHLISQLASNSYPFSTAQVQKIADGIQYGAILLIVIGNAIAPMGVVLSSVRHAGLLRRLKPLWRKLTEATPDVVLPMEFWRGPRLRLHRVVIEIGDASRYLSNYADESVRARAAAEARGSASDHTELSEALLLKWAVHVHAQGGGPGAADTTGGSPGHPESVGDAFDLDFESEVERLLLIAKHYHSPAATKFALTNTTNRNIA